MSRGYVRVPQSKRGDSSYYHSVWCTRRLEKVRSISLRGRPHGSRWVPAQPPYHFDVFVRSIGVKMFPRSAWVGLFILFIRFFFLSLSPFVRVVRSATGSRRTRMTDRIMGRLGRQQLSVCTRTCTYTPIVCACTRKGTLRKSSFYRGEYKRHGERHGKNIECRQTHTHTQ